MLDETIQLTRSMSIIAKMRKLGSMQHSFGNSQALHVAWTPLKHALSAVPGKPRLSRTTCTLLLAKVSKRLS